MNVFDLCKKNNYDKILQMIQNNEMTNLNIKDTNNNYFIHYIILHGQIEILEECLKRHINLEILDDNDKNILYIPLKFNQDEIIDMIIDYSQKKIGIPLLDFKDKKGLTSLFYCIIFNNYKIFVKLLKNNADLYIQNNEGLTPLHFIIIYSRKEMLQYIIDLNYRLNILTPTNESLLHIALKYHHFDIYTILLEQNIDIMIQETEHGLTIIHQLVLINNLKLFIHTLKRKPNLNLQDYYGNTVLHYIIIEKNYHFIKHHTEYLYNLTNYNGDTALHIILEQYNNEVKKYIGDILQHTDMNIQNNQGSTCLLLLDKHHLIPEYKDILITLPLNFFIRDIMDNSIVMNSENVSICVESYYNQLIKMIFQIV
jgi:ankyrin repeat protein